MDGEPDKVAKGLRGLTILWLALCLGACTIGAFFVVAAVGFVKGPFVDIPLLPYLLLLLVPVALVAAFVVPSKIVPKNPERAGRAAKLPDGTNDWVGTAAGDPYYWFPVYSREFLLRMGLLEGPAVFLILFFLATSNWALLGGAAVLVAAMIAQMPSRAKYDTWLDNARRRAEGEPPVG